MPDADLFNDLRTSHWNLSVIIKQSTSGRSTHHCVNDVIIKQSSSLTSNTTSCPTDSYLLKHHVQSHRMTSCTPFNHTNSPLLQRQLQSNRLTSSPVTTSSPQPPDAMTYLAATPSPRSPASWHRPGQYRQLLSLTNEFNITYS